MAGTIARAGTDDRVEPEPEGPAGEPSLRPSANRSIPRYLAGVGTLVAAYVLTAKLGLLMDAVSGFATTVWPPTGIALVALALFGYRLWPGIALGAFLVNASAGAPFLTAIGMATGNTLEAVLGTWLLRRFAAPRGALDRIQGVSTFVILVAGVSTTVSATVGVTSGWLGGVIPTANVRSAWITWWLGDAMGDLLLAPLLFVWARRPRIALSRWQAAEGAALLASLVTAGWLVFGTAVLLQPYALFPLLIWATLRFRQPGTVTTTFLVASMAIAGTAMGWGPFAQGTVHESLLLLQAFLGIVAVTMLLFAATVFERRLAQDSLRVAHDQLESRIARRTGQLTEMNRVLQEEITQRERIEESLRELSTRLLRVQDEERQRLARDLHDSTAQSLAALSINLAIAREAAHGGLDGRAKHALKECELLTDRCSKEIRSLSYLLHPPLLREVGLPAALRSCADGFAKRSGITVQVDMPGEFDRLPVEVENALYRIVQECLTNIQRHSGSPTAQIQLQRAPGWVTMEVSDQGRGMPAGILDREDAVANLGVGLLGMRERVRQLGGRLEVSSSGKGATVQVEINLASESA